MSDLFAYKQAASNPWLKLRIYQLFRITCEGLWIDKDPAFWYNAILDKDIYIEEIINIDSGGGPLDNYSISVCHKDKPSDILFEIDLTYREVIGSGKVFIERAEAVYRYISSYAKGKNWIEKAKYVKNRYGEDCPIKPIPWDNTFGPLSGVKKIKPKSGKYRALSCFDVYSLLDDITKHKRLIKNVSFTEETQERICKAKTWALFTLLEMQRYYCTSC